jgi:hypothetical protein
MPVTPGRRLRNKIVSLRPARTLSQTNKKIQTTKPRRVGGDWSL